MMSDEFYINLALEKAWETQGFALPNPSVGALVLGANGEILSLESHSVFGESHAEILAYKTAYLRLTGDKRVESLTNPFEIYEFLTKNHNGIFTQTTLFVSLEPCAHIGKTPSCAEFLCEIKPKRVVFSAQDSSNLARGGAEKLRRCGIEVRGGILKEKGEDLLLPFSCLQESGSFVLYKLAQRLNASFEGGIISNETSRTFSHHLRNAADKIIISQRTILADNPLLDARLVGGKSPDIIVVGRENHLSPNLAVFRAQNRSVRFAESLEAVDFSGFCVIEGGAEFFELCRHKIHALLLFVAPTMAQGMNFHSDFSGRILHARNLTGDAQIWLKR